MKELEDYVAKKPGDEAALSVLSYDGWHDSRFYGLLNRDEEAWGKALQGFLRLARQGNPDAREFLDFMFGDSKAQELVDNKEI